MRRAVPAPAPRPAAGNPALPKGMTGASLGPILKSLGYAPRAEGDYHRLQVDEERYGYAIDLRLSKSGEWLVAMAHLATIPDLTQVPPSPLLALLTTNDSLMGMSFSYERVNGRIMLNAAVPARAMDAASLRSLLEELRATVRRTEGLWDTSIWR